LLLVATFVLAGAAPAHAQERWTLDIRGSAAIPTAEVQGHGLGTGLGARAMLGYRFLARTGAYLDWDWHAFSPDRSFAGPRVRFEESGYALGFSFRQPLRAGDANAPVVAIRAGATYNHVALEDSGGEEITDSGYGVGWEVGAGIEFALSERVGVWPGIRYRSFSRPVVAENARVDVPLRYLSLDLGISFGF
jgi:opacity protein-like surface antigen